VLTRTHAATWLRVPEMRILAIHGVDDDNPAMVTALMQLVALA